MARGVCAAGRRDRPCARNRYRAPSHCGERSALSAGHDRSLDRGRTDARARGGHALEQHAQYQLPLAVCAVFFGWYHQSVEFSGIALLYRCDTSAACRVCGVYQAERGYPALRRAGHALDRSGPGVGSGVGDSAGRTRNGRSLGRWQRCGLFHRECHHRSASGRECSPTFHSRFSGARRQRSAHHHGVGGSGAGDRCGLALNLSCDRSGLSKY